MHKTARAVKGRGEIAPVRPRGKVASHLRDPGPATGISIPSLPSRAASQRANPRQVSPPEEGRLDRAEIEDHGRSFPQRQGHATNRTDDFLLSTLDTAGQLFLTIS